MRLLSLFQSGRRRNVRECTVLACVFILAMFGFRWMAQYDRDPFVYMGSTVAMLSMLVVAIGYGSLAAVEFLQCER
jgi:hypothetical protein